MPETYFTVDHRPDGTAWFVPTDHARGPWDQDACHAGPPTALLARALERVLPALRLARICVDLGRPIPMAGFRIDTEVARAGRATGNTRAAIVDGDGAVRATATGSHVGIGEGALFEGTLDNSGFTPPRLAEAEPGRFPIGRVGHDRAHFSGSAEVRYPPGEGSGSGATTVWMRTVALLPDEVMSPFQRICPLADCGNAFGRHLDPDQVQFVNTDLVIALHRDPIGEWMGSRAVSVWQPTGAGLAEATMFDEEGVVGRALQTLLLRSAARP